MTDLSEEGSKIYLLHSKYLDLWAESRLSLKSLRLQLDVLNRKKHEFFLHGPSEETKDWDYPVSGKIVRTDFDLYKAADKQIQELEFKIEAAKAKVDALKYIMDAINQRTFVINNMIKLEIFKGGM